MFVVVSLVAGQRTRTAEEGTAAYSTPTVIFFCAALLVAAVLSAPWHAVVYPAAILLVSGLGGIGHVLRIMYRASRHTVYRPDVEDRIWYHFLPLAAYVTVSVAAAVLLRSRALDSALFAFGTAALALIFIGIHNAWDLVTFIASGRVEQLERKAGSRDDKDEQV
jgi:hypothetical protein